MVWTMCSFRNQLPVKVFDSEVFVFHRQLSSTFSCKLAILVVFLFHFVRFMFIVKPNLSIKSLKPNPAVEKHFWCQIFVNESLVSVIRTSVKPYKRTRSQGIKFVESSSLHTCILQVFLILKMRINGFSEKTENGGEAFSPATAKERPGRISRWCSDK